MAVSLVSPVLLPPNQRANRAGPNHRNRSWWGLNRAHNLQRPPRARPACEPSQWAQTSPTEHSQNIPCRAHGT